MILIHAAGGESIGIGHLSRCQSLTFELAVSTKEPLVMVYEANKNLAHQFVIDGIKTYIVSKESEAQEKRQHELNKYKNKKNILITDLLDLNSTDSTLARQQGFTHLIHLNDSGMSQYQADLFIDGDAFKKKREYMIGGAKVLCGPSYNIVTPSIVSRRPAVSWSRALVENVLVSFGGADPGRQTESFLEQTNGVGRNLCFTTIIGPAFSPERYANIKKFASNRNKLIISPINMAELILGHDLVITLGGLTSYEAMCLGRPVASIAWSYMAYYTKQLAESGIIEDLGEIPLAIDKFNELCKNPKRLEQLANKGWNTIDGCGVNRVIKAICEFIKQ